MSDQDPGAERHINIHFSPEVMAGHYANFANVSHSDYEFTITFARVDHEVEAHRPAYHEADVACRLSALLDERGEGSAVIGRAGHVEQRYERVLGQPPRHLLVLADLDELELRVARQELRVVLDVIDVRRTQTADGQHGELHRLRY